MAELTVIQNNFSSGELSKLVQARQDIEKYNQGLSVAENILLLPQGGMTMAWGTEFVAEVKDHTKKVRMKRFEFSTLQAYMLEFGSGYVRFYRDRGQIGAVITGAVDNGSGLIRITSPSHSLITNDTVFVSDVGGVPAATGYWIVTVISASQFDLNGSSFSGTYTSGGKWVSETATPYLEADLFELHFVQSADVLWIYHPDYFTRKLSRTSHTTWTLTKAPFTGGPFRTKDPAVTTTITPSVTTGSGTLTASAALFTVDHVDAFWELTHGATTGYVKITSFTSPTVVNMTVQKTLGATTATAIWREGMWSAERGWPAAATLHEERIVAGGSPDDSASFAGSVSGSYDDYSENTKQADDSYIFQIGASDVPSIVWMASGSQMMIGTPGGVFKATGGSDNPITPTNVFVRRQTSIGSSQIAAVVVESDFFFIQRSKKHIRRLQFDLESDAFKAEQASILATHIMKPNAVVMASQSEPFDLIWIVRSDGQLVTLTTLEQQKIRGFARRFSPGPTAETIDPFESVDVIPSPDGTSEDTWFSVRRIINGVSKRYVEHTTVSDPEAPDLYSYLDSGLTYEGAATTVVSGLTHLEGRTVGIIADGKEYPSAVVTGGSVTLNGTAATKIRVGIIFPAKGDTVSPEVTLQNGISSGRKRRLAKAKIYFLKSLGVSFLGAEANLPEELNFRKANDPMDSAPPPFTGYKSISNTGWSDEGKVSIRQLHPLPFTVLSITGNLEVGDI